MTPGRRRDRAQWGTITRQAIVAKAMEVVGRHGSAELSVRGLATELHVSPMALYRHIENLDDLLDEVVGLLLAARWRPTVDETDWRAWIVDAADRLRELLVEEPAAMQIYLRRPVVSAPALERMDACLTVLNRALSDDKRAHSAYAAVQSYTIGFAALEAARRPYLATHGLADTAGEPVNSLHELATYSLPRQFHDGLDYLLLGIADAAARG